MIILLKISDEMTEKNVEEFHNKKYRLPYKLGGGCPKEQYDTKTYYLETAREIWQEYNDGI